MMLVSCVEHFRQLLQSLPANATVTRVMSVVPSPDGSGMWSMVPVQAIELRENGDRSTFMIDLVNGTHYEESAWNVALVRDQLTLYRAD